MRNVVGLPLASRFPARSCTKKIVPRSKKKHRNDDNQHHGTGWNAAKNAKDDIQQPLSITTIKIVQKNRSFPYFAVDEWTSS